MSFDPTREGACFLFDGIKKWALIGQHPHEQTNRLNELKNAIGYMAYPNPNLKNDIPDRQFYEYDRLQSSRRPLPSPTGRYQTSGRLEQSVTKTRYIKKIQKIKELLAAGEVYQINFAIRFRKTFAGDPYALFYRLAQSNPTPFSAYLNGGNFQIVSASPERLFKVRNRIIRTQPIKGTVSKAGGKRALNRLLKSEKERAELDMITDLERNDLGRICQFGSVRLIKERAVMGLPNLWHTYSEIRGRARPDISKSEIIDALFPGGSITGCPKIRAMEYIEKLEGLPRNIFTGSIGYAWGDTMDFNIAIRTALIHHGLIEFWAGGGIVFDSDPEKEYEECLLKAENFLALL